MGGPGHLENTLKAINRRIFAWFFFSGVLLIGGFWVGSELADLEPMVLYAGLAGGWLLVSLIAAAMASRSATSPLKALSQAILHISPSPIPVKSPDTDKLRVGRELVSNLIRQVYELNTGAGHIGASINDMGLQQLPVAVISIDQEANVTFANVKAKEMIGHNEEITGKNLYSLADIYFQNEETLQNWIEQARNNTITSQKIWHAVKMDTHGREPEYIDLAASYSKQTQKGTEVVLVLFDETDVYAEQEQSLSFVSLAVHELRTPLTMLRGYIEVFEDELGGNKPELKTYFDRTKAAAETLTAFVGNILNVARIDQNQLTLKLNKENWNETLKGIVDEMRLRAQVRGKQIELTIADGLPEVGIDRVSISEVMVNLLDNAIKYSPPDKTLIKVNSQLNQEGQIETTVQDFGVGISENVLPHLFEKFSRSHRSKNNVLGTGLGLYLSNALIKAHGGNIWVRSKEGQGSIFGFTVLPYDKVAEIEPNSDNGITRNAHGWIKNHSLSRH